jgi:type II secretory pathway component PulF
MASKKNKEPDISAFEIWFTKIQFGGKPRLSAYKKLSRFLKNGMPLKDALITMYQHASDEGKNPKTPNAIVFRLWKEAVQNGIPFGRAIEGWVPPGEQILIEAGDESGRLAEVLDNAIFVYGAQKKIKGTLMGALAYPVFLILIAIGFMFVAGKQVIPAFEDIVSRDKWEGQAAQMGDLADFVNNYLVATIISSIAIVITIIVTMPRWTGKIRAKVDNYPPWSLNRLMAGTSFLLAFAALNKAGVQTSRAIKIMRRGASPWYEERLNAVDLLLANGKNIGDALWMSGFNFPDKEMVKDLRSYAALDGFDETLNNLAKEWLDDTVEKISIQASLMKNLAMVFLGLVFGFITTGIMALQQTVTRGL